MLTEPTLLHRPQPLGIFAWPVGNLLLPRVADEQLPTSQSGADEQLLMSQAAALALLNGERPSAWPEAWQFYAAALDGDLDRAKHLLAADTGPVAAYNRFMLEPSPARYAEASRAATGKLAVLVAVGAYSVGLGDHLPAADALDGELAAHLLAAHAAAALAGGDSSRAIDWLEQAVSAARAASPLLAAQLLGQLVGLLRDSPQRCHEALPLAQQAVQLASQTPLVRLRAELWYTLGETFHQLADNRRDWLLQAVKAYQQAIQCGLSLDSHPDLYAQTQNNLGLAYLAIPVVSASDQLRWAIAVQSLREALKVYTRPTHPQRWASVALNLANALQYMPSGHPADNLMQAVELYDQILEVRDRAADPLGYARVLANQANALAHLGIFPVALEKLNEAYKLFHWHNETDAAASVLQLVEQISACRQAAFTQPSS
jgi:tetratricopeptide (TPR) repeat protein